MKKILFLSITLAIMASCSNKPKNAFDLKTDKEAFSMKLGEIFNDSTMTEAQQMEAAGKYTKDTYDAHRQDSLGLSAFIYYVTNFAEPQEAVAMYEEACDLIREDPMAKVKVQSIKNLENVKIGDLFLEIAGPDALTGKELSISAVLAQGKPVLLDFWASWCGPCRREIKGHLLDLAATGKVNILGIAVWENSQDDTVKAMKELGITWPVIFTGGRENSPSITYGVSSIPTLILLSADGKILGRGHSTEEIAFFNE